MSKRQFCRMPHGGLIDRDRVIAFTFNGRKLHGYEGDTLASALVANGIRLISRSFKYHRPRGLIGAGTEEPNALVQIGRGAKAEVNVRATEVLLREGLQARSINCWPSVKFDVGGINNLASHFLAAGFYYKTFMWPTWHLYEWAIRRAAGLGNAPEEADPDFYENHYDHCDVLVVGGGAAGLAAARAAAAGGARVILAEQDSRLGGRLLWDEAQIDAMPGQDWVDQASTELGAMPEARVLTRTSAIGYFDHNAIVMVQQLPDGHGPRQRLWQVRARKVILATGALERPLVFPGNDRPGVMLASAVRQYVGRYAAMPGRQAVIFTNNDEAYLTAETLHRHGIKVEAIVDSRTEPSQHLENRANLLGIPLIAGGTITSTVGARSLKSVTVRDAVGKMIKFKADLLAMSGGHNPTVHLFCQSGGQLAYDTEHAMLKPGVSAQQETSVGVAAGDMELGSSLRQAHDAGLVAAAACGFAPVPEPRAPEAVGLAYAVEPAWEPASYDGKAFVDFQNDVTASDIALAARENFQSIEHLKRYTTLGMAPDQGKTSNVNGLAIMASLTGREITEVGTTRYRFPFTPVSFGALSGSSRGDYFRPIRRMPAHAVHAGYGAVFEDYGAWKRPAYYLRDGETPGDAEQREALAVRQAVGLFEGSPLGKIEVMGPDAAVFLDRIYANTMSTLKVGRARYGLMLNELGVLIDDGVALRLAEDRFWVGTTGGGADRIAAWMEEWLQCEWLDLKVIVAPVTQAWAVLTLTGPLARTVLETVGVSASIAAQDFPHMSFADMQVAGIPARIARVSYTGEISFEINIPSSQAEHLWHRLMQAGAQLDIAPVGVDAWMLLRTEKGFLHIGADTDGSTTPLDVGWDHVLKKKSDFVGRRSLTRPADSASDRLQFVGLRPLSGKAPPIGAHLASTAGGGSEGYVTSAGHSPILSRGVALGMVKGGRSRMREVLRLASGGREDRVEIIEICAYDPAGERLNG
ncbi:sarcosine oxidase subunit alpha family protein [Novosphingobium sp. AP12]|uniref:sarcosine oxidase subunit alpha family protein n=1 Tax=Novosphingobium sp. AP12 TaxID=1144305 RepID=UPI0002720018|nr:sarcosine oxidase subunit alpha family protein [Novosphingobium sp. AP12]EJL30856.1 sarcosine oxidase, alpha subunit family, heterotetrameric form [Novosphingobium sp. AP12]